MAVTDWVVFASMAQGPLNTPAQVIAGYTFEDLGMVQGTPPPPWSGLQILTLPFAGAPVNQLFIGQGRVRVAPTAEKLETIGEHLGKEVSGFEISILTKHYFGGPGQPTVQAYDNSGTLVDAAVGTELQGVPDKLLVAHPQIRHIDIEGVEVAIAKICFVFD